MGGDDPAKEGLPVIGGEPPDLDVIFGEMTPDRKQQPGDQIDRAGAGLVLERIIFGLPGLAELLPARGGP